MRTRLYFRTAAALTVGVMAAACSSNSTSSPSPGTASGAPPAANGIALGSDSAKSTLHVGGGDLVFDVFAPFSGPDARFGAHALPGAQVGAYAINQAGGVLGHMLKIVHTDSRGDPADAVPALQKALAATSNLEAVLGP